MPLTVVDQGLLSSTAQYTGFKNRIINGAMMVSQYNGTNTVTGGVGYTFTVDRFKFYSSAASRLSGQRVASTYAGFVNRLKLTSLAVTTPAAADEYELYQNIEGLNVADLNWGTASASSVTLSFVVSSSLTGTFAGCLNNGGAGGSNTCFVFTYSIPTANTDTFISVTIPGPTIGTWATDNSLGIQVIWDLGSGSNYNGTAGAWGTGFKSRTSGSVTLVGTNGATFYITGVQLEKGSTATSFDYRPYGTELQLCQRYCQNIRSAEGNGTYLRYGYGESTSTTGAGVNVNLFATMRITPSLTTAAANQYGFFSGGAINTAITIALGPDGSSPSVANVGIGTTGLTTGRAGAILSNNNNTSYLLFTAEL